MDTSLPDYLIQAGERATQAQQGVSNLGSYAGSIPDALKTAVQNAYNDNRDILKQLDTATAEYYSAPATAREKFQDIWNPFERERLVSQYTSNKMIPWLSYSGIYGQRMGRAGDLINAGVGAYQADVAARQAAADAAQRTYENALQQYQLEEDRRRWEAEQAGQGSALQAILDLINKQNEQLKIPEVPSSVGVTSFIKDEDTNFPINTYPNPTNTGNITAYTAPTQSIYNVGSTTSPFTNVGGIDLGSAPQAPQVKPSLWSRIRSLLGWRE
jgi:type II secretory pathway pseudopilin PulG